MTDNPVDAAREAYMRTHPYRADEVEAAMKAAVEGSEAGEPVPAGAGEHDPAPASEQLGLELGVCATCSDSKQVWNERLGGYVKCPECARPDPGREKVGAYHRFASDTERLAALAVAGHSGTQRLAVVNALRSAGATGMTDNELHFTAGIGARPHVPGSRRGELIEDGWPIIDSGRRRKTDTGNTAIVWVLVE